MGQSHTEMARHRGGLETYSEKRRATLWRSVCNMQPIDTVLFDLDGTIVHHGNALMPVIFSEWGYQHTYDEIKTAVRR